MFKYVLSAFICLAFAMPAAAQCGCDSAAAGRTPRKLAFVPVKRSLPQISMKCVTDECGCSRRKLSISKVEVTGARLGLVDREPRDKGKLKNLFSGRLMGGQAAAPEAAAHEAAAHEAESCGCEEEAVAEPCGCEVVEESCGCGEMESEPTYADPMIYSEPVAAPADCGCNG